MNEIEHIFFNKLTKRSDKWYPYFHAYEKHLNKFKQKDCNLLEIGVKGGGSLELWHHYIGSKCNLYGVDIEPTTLDIKYDFDVDLTIGDQEDLKFWDSYTKNKDTFDIIIDDGGHTMKQQENTLMALFPKLNYGGVYIIEDTHTSYWQEFQGGLNKKGTFVELMKSLADTLHIRHIKQGKPTFNTENIFHGLSSVTFYDSMVVLEKEIPRDFKRVIFTP